VSKNSDREFFYGLLLFNFAVHDYQNSKPIFCKNRSPSPFCFPLQPILMGCSDDMFAEIDEQSY